MNTFGSSAESLRPVILHARTQMNGPGELDQVVQAVEKLRMALLR